MQDILTITLNPAVDLSTATDQVEPGPKLRCDPPRSDPGGGGINVSRTIRVLGGRSRALVALGGATGRMLRDLLQAEGIDYLPFRAPGETRQSLAVTDRGTGQQYRFVMPGPAWDEAHSVAMLAMIGQSVIRDGYVVVSGSNPPGLQEDFITRVAARLEGSGAKLIVDTSGPALRHLATPPAKTPPPYVLRMDQEEAEALAGRPLPARADSAGFAARLVEEGAAAVVIVARGADGSVLAAGGRRLHVAAADVPIRSKVGAGDSFVGAFTLSLARNASLAKALQHGAAAASATVITEATQLCTREDTARLVAESVLSEL
ncbi:1-phosphofructokinase family hexose kinase [Actibacterium sp. MT2.3-13A]|uniref:1-phosphofructokinase family hexose kinase n=1 Tax=Actibacterium sp. MT2.3-13A TaxID=2828332 RepID=UPI001BACED98|nr:1-phosphofructokinase family hexose kinase [Actibacterium sp. MT2.3-13A]